MKDYLNLIRVKHWIKNFLIFLPLIFSKQILDFNKGILTIISFFSFSFLASSIYVFNDLKDIEKDKLHPVKKERPLAKGVIKKKNAILLFVFLLIISLLLACFNYFLSHNFKSFIIFVILLLSYFIINIFYSIILKNIPIVDVSVIVYGFLVRVFLGSVITNIPISNFLYLTIMTGSFFVAFGKRRNEIIKSNDSTRKVLKKYNKDFLDKFMYICLTLTIVFYSMWCIDLNTQEWIGNGFAVWTIPFIIIILMKYSLNIEGDSFGDPVDVILKDKVLIMLSFCYILVMGIIIYFI